jgi:hypothetical protein
MGCHCFKVLLKPVLIYGHGGRVGVYAGLLCFSRDLTNMKFAHNFKPEIQNAISHPFFDRLPSNLAY